MGSVKKALLDLAQNLPDECTWDDVMQELYVRQKIAVGIKDVEGGRLVSHGEVFAEYED